MAELLAAAVLCNDAGLHQGAEGWTINGDPTEAALLVAALSEDATGGHHQSLAAAIDAIPFASETQSMLTLHDGETRLAVLKGAPEVVLQRCVEADNAEVHQQMVEAMHRLGGGGMRVLALASMPWPAGQLLPDEVPSTGFRFLGLIGMIDPPRERPLPPLPPATVPVLW